MKSIKNFSKPVPTQYKEQVGLTFHWRVPFKDRIKILIGYDVDFKLHLQTQHKAGKIATKMDIQTTPEKS